MSNVLDDPMHGSAKQLLFFVVHRHDDEQFRASRRVIVDLSQREPSIFEVVGVARRSRVPHVRKLALVAQRTHVEQLGGYSRVEHKVAVEQLDLFERLVTSRNALRYSTIANVGFKLSVVGVRDVLVSAWDSGARVGTLSLEEWHVACIRVVFQGMI